MTGLASGFEVAFVSINGQKAAVRQDGYFELKVPLSLGENALETVAIGTLGERVTGTLRVTRVAAAITSLSAWWAAGSWRCSPSWRCCRRCGAAQPAWRTPR